MIKTRPYDFASYIDSDEMVVALLEEVFEVGDPHMIAWALGAIARAQGIASLVEPTGLSRAALYRAFGKNGNPTLATLLAMLKALGIKLEAKPVAKAA